MKAYYLVVASKSNNQPLMVVDTTSEETASKEAYLEEKGRNEYNGGGCRSIYYELKSRVIPRRSKEIPSVSSLAWKRKSEVLVTRASKSVVTAIIVQKKMNAGGLIEFEDKGDSGLKRQGVYTYDDFNIGRFIQSGKVTCCGFDTRGNKHEKGVRAARSGVEQPADFAKVGARAETVKV